MANDIVLPVPEQIGIEPCPCGRCRDYHLSNAGKFVQGSGFTRDEAIFIAMAPAMYRALQGATKALIAERDCLYDSAAVLGTGEVPDPDDREAIADLDKLIDECRAAMTKAVGDN